MAYITCSPHCYTFLCHSTCNKCSQDSGRVFIQPVSFVLGCVCVCMNVCSIFISLPTRRTRREQKKWLGFVALSTRAPHHFVAYFLRYKIQHAKQLDFKILHIGISSKIDTHTHKHTQKEAACGRSVCVCLFFTYSEKKKLSIFFVDVCSGPLIKMNRI